MTSQPEPAPLFSVPNETRSRTSEVLRSLAERSDHANVSLRTLTEGLGDRSFGMLLILIAVFNVLPLISIISGLLVIALGAQMALGLRQARLPRFILDRQLPPDKVKSALLSVAPRVRKIERYIRPRWHFTEAPIVDRINGIVLALLGCIIAIPLPLTNLAPAAIVIMMGMGLLERDGLVQVIAAALGLAAIVTILTLFTAG
ncbi:MAG: ABC transporter permease [Oleiphilus sp.]|nr:MAG: ABC transporter permease [Oleiphilus sp.]